MPPTPFPPVDRAAWRAAVTRELKGRDPDRALARQTEDGLRLHPLYMRGDGPEAPPEASGDRAVGPLPWGVDASYATAESLSSIAEDLAGGVTGLRITAPLTGPEALGELPPGLHLELDGACAEWASNLEATVSFRGDAGAHLAAGRTASISSEEWASAGATGLQEVGWLVAAALSALRTEPSGQLEITVTVGREVFPGIAKLRALRLLLARTVAAWGTDTPTPTLRAVTHPAVLTARDPWVNLLRGAHGAVAAILGGADRIEVLPFDAALGQPDGLARRVARNTSQVLGLESHLGRIRDPAAGSWFLESLTQHTAQGAWAEFQRIGGDLGFPDALSSGRLDDLCASSWEARADRIADRSLPVTGVSEFPDAAAPLQRSGAARSNGHRDSEDWEALRARVQAHGTRVLLATWGPRAEWNARAMWTENLLRAGGFTVDVHEGGDPDGLVDAYAAESYDAVCLCATDARYVQAAEVAKSFRELGADLLLLAGRPGEDVANADLDLLLHAGAPVLERLTALAATAVDDLR